MIPKISVIIPTTHDRSLFNERILLIFHTQDYVNKEVIFDYNAGTIGEKLNRLCESATGDIIMRFDSDDFYQSDWISKSVHTLIENKCDVTGMHTFNLYDPIKKEGWKYTYSGDDRLFLAGATMCFWKEYWRGNLFPDKCESGEDVLWMYRMPSDRKSYAHNYIEGFLATIHEGNTSPKLINVNPRYRRMREDEENRIRERFGSRGSSSIKHRCDSTGRNQEFY